MQDRSNTLFSERVESQTAGAPPQGNSFMLNAIPFRPQATSYNAGNTGAAPSKPSSHASSSSAVAGCGSTGMPTLEQRQKEINMLTQLLHETQLQQLQQS